MDMNIILYLLIGLPILAEVGYLFNVMRITTILSAILILILTVLIHSALPIAGLFYITNFNWILILMVGSIYLLSALFSYDYLKERSIRMDLNYYYVFMNLFVATMLFSLIINNYGLMWAGIEATTITSALLVMTEQTSISVKLHGDI